MSKTCLTVLVGSMDVEALYPSIDIEFAAQKCTELLLETGIKFKNVNIAELGLFLIYNESVSKLEQAGLLKYCPTRTSRCGRNPLFTASGTSSSRDVRCHWTELTMQPDDYNKMVVHAIGVTLRYI